MPQRADSSVESMETQFYNMGSDPSLKALQTLKRRIRTYAGVPGADLKRGKQLLIRVERRIRRKLSKAKGKRRRSSASKKKETDTV